MPWVESGLHILVWLEFGISYICSPWQFVIASFLGTIFARRRRRSGGIGRCSLERMRKPGPLAEEELRWGVPKKTIPPAFRKMLFHLLVVDEARIIACAIEIRFIWGTSVMDAPLWPGFHPNHESRRQWVSQRHHCFDRPINLALYQQNHWWL